MICYLDDILVCDSTNEEHHQNLEAVLQRLQEFNINADRDKCILMVDSVEYLGHRIDASGLHTLSTKVKAVQEAPRPKNQQELRSFLGSLQYYGKFIPNLSTVLGGVGRRNAPEHLRQPRTCLLQLLFWLTIIRPCQ